MDGEKLKWETRDVRLLLRTPVFSVMGQHERAANGIEGDYIALEAPDCVVVIAEADDSFVLVRQFRHGAACLTAEFPGGVIDRGEAPETAARRELEEETGCRAGKLTYLGCCSPNPALFRSVIHFFLAEELESTGVQHLDRDELIEIVRTPKAEVISSFGRGEELHAFMGTALLFYLRHRSGGNIPL